MINLSSVSEVQYVGVELQSIQNQVRTVHGYAIIGIQCVIQIDVDQLSVFKLGFHCASVHLGKVRSSKLAAQGEREAELNDQS